MNTFDDAYREYHSRHHTKTGSPTDSDLFFAASPLPKIGLASALNHYSGVTVADPGSSWDDQTFKLFRQEAFRLLATDPRYKNLAETLHASWLGSSFSGGIIL